MEKRAFRDLKNLQVIESYEKSDDHQYYAGIEYPHIAIYERSMKSIVHIENIHTDKERVADILEDWNVRVAYADEQFYFVEWLQRRGLPVKRFTMATRTKNRIVEAIDYAISKKAIAFIQSDDLINQMASYRLKLIGRRQYTYRTADSSEDESIIIACALALHAATTGGIRVNFA